MTPDKAKVRQITGRTVLFCLIGFFAVVFAVNGAMISLALSTNSGALGSPYRTGLKYNERIAAAEQQANLGWSSDISIDAGSRRLVAILNDRDGKPLHGLKASATVGLAVTDRDDVTGPLDETSPGHYEMALRAGDVGNLVADLEVTDPDSSQGVVYRARRRLWLKP